MIDYGVYLVTDAPERYPAGLLAGVETALAGGVSVVQYRATGGTRREQFEAARALHEMLRVRGVPLVINDAVDLALAVNAEGVHVGQSDMPTDVVRRLLGPGRLLGLSITELAQLQVVGAEVDYLGVGPVYATPTKPDAAPPLGLDGLRAVKAQARLPVVAIGGINLANAAAVFAAGAAGVAVVSAFSQAADPAAVARALRAAKGAAR
ncbi:thiamine phosphate synthase [Opitutus sp. ER46]|uniref:thiamine phosphate synthase n=1 Tax=Opitutus sp. ER46 TaxID=2161864 RepID=UPI000D309733|nr:thiamine phosphate synthase [Opitutus sp. ER46]PTX99105.1 thiamine phosphate synthase [Opitutus sp. ER46]